MGRVKNMMNKKTVSVVVPVYNEEDNIVSLHKEIVDSCEQTKNDGLISAYEIIFVNDGSSDNTDRICRNLKPLKYIQLRRNFGQTAAMDAGIKTSTGDYIITMDGDGQNDPADIPNLILHLQSNNLDVVSGWRKNRKDTFLKRFISRGANALRYLLIHDGIHDSGCSLKIYKKECFDGVNLYGEQHRFIPAILKIKGFQVGEIIVNHRPRVGGKTKYNWKRTIKGFLDMISVWFWNKYATRPLHLLGAFGVLFLSIGGGCGIWSICLFVKGAEMSDNIVPPILTVFFVIIGIMMIIFGLMSEILVKIYFGVHADSSYSIKCIEEYKI